MNSFKRLDAWKACHTLTLSVYRATEGMSEKEPDVAEQLRQAGYRTAG